MSGDSAEYVRRKAEFARCLTVYGRKSVLEALQCAGVRCERLHLAASNRPAEILDRIVALAEAHGAIIRTHTRSALAHISRNAREDQGVAADLRWPGYRTLEALLEEPTGGTLLAVDGVTNPQNLGMLIRSGAAAGVRGILLPRSGGCDIGPLVIKASAGSMFRAPLLRCAALPEALERLRGAGWRVAVLDATGSRDLFALGPGIARVFVLGSESGGISAGVAALADERVAIPMANGVESLNVAVTAALVGYHAAIAAAPLSG
jgi:23S rRNA (guanosine2251-2'-O)-methyltransferase